MHPILFEIQAIHFKLHLYGVMYAFAFMLGYVWLRYESRRVGLHVEQMANLFFYILIAGTVGARVFYVLVEEPYLISTPLEIFKIWQGGLVYYGGLIGALLMGIAYCFKYRLSFFKVVDVFAPGLALGHVFGRIGCLFAGCCYGRLCDASAWYALRFPDVPSGIAPPHLPLYPTQLIESMGNLVLFIFLALFRKKKTFDGQVFLLYVSGYALMRSGVEVFRGDVERGYVVDGVLSTSQFVSLLAIIGAAILWVFQKRYASLKKLEKLGSR